MINGQKAPILMGCLGSILAVLIFIWGAQQQANNVNTDINATDQSAYIDYAKNMAQTNWQFIGGRNRMPLYPSLMSLFYKDGMSDDRFFARGKQVGIGIGLICLGAVFFLFCQKVHRFDSLVATLIAAFTVFAYKAPYFQAEIIYYTISLALFYLLHKFIAEPTHKTAILAGVIGGLGHLTKASVMPALALAVGLAFLQIIPDFWQKWHGEEKEQAFFITTVWKKFANILLLVGCFVLVIFPYIHTSKERFGRYFYNVNSTFYIWYDSWAEATQGTKAHGDRIGWPDMPPEEIPSLQKYVRDHTNQQIVNRFITGYQTIYTKVTRSYGYIWFLLAYLLLTLGLIVQNPNLLTAASLWQSLFIVGYFVGHSLLYAWYAPIASGNRFILSLFLPILLLFGSFLSAARTQDAKFRILKWRISASAVSPIMLALLVGYIVFIFPEQVSTMYGGS